MSSHSHSSRCYPNPHVSSKSSAEAPSKPLGSAEISWLCSQMHAMMQSISAEVEAAAIASQGSELPDETLYEGTGGAAYAMLHVCRALSHLPKESQSLQSMHSFVGQLPAVAFLLADRSAKIHAQSHHQPRITFFMGSGGILATRILTAMHSTESSRMQVISADMQALLALKHNDDSLPNEILYGRTGLLHSLLLVHNSIINVESLPSKFAPQLKLKMDTLFDEVIASGVSFTEKPKSCPLMWAWHGKRYLGAAHGVTGILCILMQCAWRFEGSSKEAAQVRALVQGTLDYCISIRMPSGNFPSSVPDAGESSSDKLVQWCHGAPGLAFACLYAYSLWSDPKHLQVAVESAQVVWERGLLKKGVGLCHGIAGNAYVFLRLFEVTRDQSQLSRAYSFMYFALAGTHREELLAQPDVPNSLANGKAGCACALADLISCMSQSMQSASQEEERKSAAASASSSSAAAAAAPSSSSSSSSAAASAPTTFSLLSSFPGMDARLPCALLPSQPLSLRPLGSERSHATTGSK